jgi:hypothetical protein
MVDASLLAARQQGRLLVDRHLDAAARGARPTPEDFDAAEAVLDQAVGFGDWSLLTTVSVLLVGLRRLAVEPALLERAKVTCLLLGDPMGRAMADGKNLECLGRAPSKEAA